MFEPVFLKLPRITLKGVTHGALHVIKNEIQIESLEVYETFLPT